MRVACTAPHSTASVTASLRRISVKQGEQAVANLLATSEHQHDPIQDQSSCELDRSAAQHVPAPAAAGVPPSAWLRDATRSLSFSLSEATSISSASGCTSTSSEDLRAVLAACAERTHKSMLPQQASGGTNDRDVAATQPYGEHTAERAGRGADREAGPSTSGKSTPNSDPDAECAVVVMQLVGRCARAPCRVTCLLCRSRVHPAIAMQRLHAPRTAVPLRTCCLHHRARTRMRTASRADIDNKQAAVHAV